MSLVRDYIPASLSYDDKNFLLERFNIRKDRLMTLGRNPAVIIVDMTNGFVTNEYGMGWAKTGIPCAHSIRTLLVLCRTRHIPIIYTRAVMRNTVEAGKWIDKTSLLPISEPRFSEIYHDIAPEEGDVIIEKSKPSAFFGTQLASILNLFPVDTLIISGMTTSGCVRATVVDAFSFNYHVIIPEECVADRFQTSHEISLFDMSIKYGDVTSLNKILELVENNKVDKDIR